MKTMKQAILTHSGFEIRDTPLPRLGPGEALVRIVGNGVCAGDVDKFRDARARRDQELLLGHEASGVVAEADALAAPFRPGDRVTALGGFFAEYHVFTPEQLVHLPETINPRYALGEPVACCVHAMARSRTKAGDRVAVVGCGFMGLLCLQLARHAGAVVTALDTRPARLDMALRLGATAAFEAHSMQPGGPCGSSSDFEGAYDVVVEAAGTQSALDLCGFLARQHGLLLIVGRHHSNGGMRRIYMDQWNVKALDVVNGHVRRNAEKRDAMARGMALIAEGALTLEPLITCYPLARIQEAFDACATNRDDLFKAVILTEERP